MGYVDFIKNRNKQKDMETVAMVKSTGTKQSKQI